MKDIYRLKLHEEWVNPNDACSRAMRVPGGWVYSQIGHSAFVPYHNEFEPRPDEPDTDEGEAV